MTNTERADVLEAVLDAVLELDEPMLPSYRTKLANLIRRDVARRLTPPASVPAFPTFSEESR